MRSPSVPIYCAARILLEREDARQIAPVSIKMYNIAFREGGEKQGYYHATAHINIFGRDKHHGVHTVLKESIVPGSCGRHDWHAQLRICKHGMAAAAARGRCTYACRGRHRLTATGTWQHGIKKQASVSNVHRAATVAGSTVWQVLRAAHQHASARYGVRAARGGCVQGGYLHLDYLPPAAVG